MCGRYVVVTKLQTIEKRFNVKSTYVDELEANTNVSHGNYAPVITNDEPQQLQLFKFGFTPFWAKKQYYMVNARSEGSFNKEDDPQYTGGMGIFQKPMFRHAIKSKRCLVVVDAFIEGPKKERLSKPYVVYLKDKRRPFALAGIWDQWVNKTTGEIINSHAVITTVANELLQSIGHHRSPVILSEEHEQDWLSNDLSVDEIVSLMQPYPAEEMNAYPVSAAIKSPKGNGLELLEPIGERIYPEYKYELYQELKREGMGATTARARKNEEEG